MQRLSTVLRRFNSSLPKAYFDISLDGEEAGRVVFNLRTDVTPKTATNFLELCTGEHGFGYEGSSFHRIIPEFMAQAGDFTNHNGTGGKSIYGEEFEDENWDLKHGDFPRGALSMANRGPHTNGSQFFITFVDCSFLDGNHVVFGNVVDGFEVLDQLEAVGSAPHGETSKVVLIEKAGVLDEEEAKVYEL